MTIEACYQQLSDILAYHPTPDTVPVAWDELIATLSVDNAQLTFLTLSLEDNVNPGDIPATIENAIDISPSTSPTSSSETLPVIAIDPLWIVHTKRLLACAAVLEQIIQKTDTIPTSGPVASSHDSNSHASLATNSQFIAYLTQINTYIEAYVTPLQLQLSTYATEQARQIEDNIKLICTSYRMLMAVYLQTNAPALTFLSVFNNYLFKESHKVYFRNLPPEYLRYHPYLQFLSLLHGNTLPYLDDAHRKNISFSRDNRFFENNAQLPLFITDYLGYYPAAHQKVNYREFLLRLIDVLFVFIDMPIKLNNLSIFENILLLLMHASIVGTLNMNDLDDKTTNIVHNVLCILDELIADESKNINLFIVNCFFRLYEKSLNRHKENHYYTSNLKEFLYSPRAKQIKISLKHDHKQMFVDAAMHKSTTMDSAAYRTICEFFSTNPHYRQSIVNFLSTHGINLSRAMPRLFGTTTQKSRDLLEHFRELDIKTTDQKTFNLELEQLYGIYEAYTSMTMKDNADDLVHKLSTLLYDRFVSSDLIKLKNLLEHGYPRLHDDLLAEMQKRGLLQTTSYLSIATPSITAKTTDGSSSNYHFGTIDEENILGTVGQMLTTLVTIFITIADQKEKNHVIIIVRKANKNIKDIENITATMTNVIKCFFEQYEPKEYANEWQALYQYIENYNPKSITAFLKSIRDNITENFNLNSAINERIIGYMRTIIAICEQTDIHKITAKDIQYMFLYLLSEVIYQSEPSASARRDSEANEQSDLFALIQSHLIAEFISSSLVPLIQTFGELNFNNSAIIKIIEDDFSIYDLDLISELEQFIHRYCLSEEQTVLFRQVILPLKGAMLSLRVEHDQKYNSDETIEKTTATVMELFHTIHPFGEMQGMQSLERLHNWLTALQDCCQQTTVREILNERIKQDPEITVTPEDPQRIQTVKQRLGLGHPWLNTCILLEASFRAILKEQARLVPPTVISSQPQQSSLNIAKAAAPAVKPTQATPGVPLAQSATRFLNRWFGSGPSSDSTPASSNSSHNQKR